jgi:hypothetical protein
MRGVGAPVNQSDRTAARPTSRAAGARSALTRAQPLRSRVLLRRRAVRALWLGRGREHDGCQRGFMNLLGFVLHGDRAPNRGGERRGRGSVPSVRGAVLLARRRARVRRVRELGGARVPGVRLPVAGAGGRRRRRRVPATWVPGPRVNERPRPPVCFAGILRCETCRALCAMRLRTTTTAARIRIVALHRCLKCSGAQVITVRDTQGDLHRVQVDSEGHAVIDERPASGRLN